MPRKVVSLDRAVELVNSGSFLAVGGMTLYRKPIAFIRQLIKKRINNLKLLSFAGSYDVDLLIAAGCIEEIRTCYTGMEFLGLAPSFRAAVEQRRVRLIEETELTITAGITAALQRAPFYAVRQLLGTEILEVRKDIKVFNSPTDGEPTVAIPPLKPDIAVIHVQKCDAYGNAMIQGQLCIDKQLAQVADTVILTTEKIVETKEIESSDCKAQINGYDVSAVVRVPFGAYPTSCFPNYTLDVRHLLHYLNVTKEHGVERYLDEYIYQTADHEQYLEKASGIKNLLQLLF